MAALEEVTRAMHALIRSTSNEQRQAADRWLSEFLAQPEAWGAVEQLLSADDSTANLFGAILLHSKIQNDFSQLAPENAEQLKQALLQQLFFRASQRPMDAALVTRLCVSLAALAVQMNQRGVLTSILTSMNTLIEHAPEVVLELVQALAEECANERINVDENVRTQFMKELSDSATDVIAFLGVTLQSNQSHAAQSQILKCMKQWVMHIDLPVGTLMSSPVMQFAYQSLQNPDMVEDAASLLVEVLEKYVPGEDSGLVLSNIGPAVLSTQTFLEHAMQQEEEDVVRSLCNLFTGLAEACTPWMASDTDVNQGTLLQVLLRLTAYPESKIATTPLRFWYLLSEVLAGKGASRSAAQYIPFFADAFKELVAVCIHQMRLPAEAERMRKELLDEALRTRDEFEDTLLDCAAVLQAVTVMGLIGSRLESELGAAAGQAPAVAWVGVEACLKAASVVASRVPGSDASVLPRFLELAPHFPEQQFVRIASYKLLGEMSGWLSENPQHIHSVVSYLSAGLQPQSLSSSSAAAKAIRRISEDCAAHLGEPFFQLHDQLLAARRLGTVESPAIRFGAELDILEALCYVASSLPVDRCEAAVHAFAQPVLADLEQLLGQAQVPPKRALLNDIDRLCTILRYTKPEVASGTPHPVIRLFTAAWPLLQRSFKAYPNSFQLAEKVCRCYKHTIRNSPRHFYAYDNLVAEMIQHVATYFEATHQAPFLYAASICVAEYGGVPELVGPLYEMLEVISTKFFELIQNAEHFAEHPDVVEEYFYLVSRFLNVCPEPLLRSSSIEVLFNAAVAGVSVHHREAQKGVLCFFEKLLRLALQHATRPDDVSQLAGNFIIEHGQTLMNALIYSLAGQTPAYAIDEDHGSFTDALWSLKMFSQRAFNTWLQTALQQLPPRLQEEAQKMEMAQSLDAYNDPKLIGDVVYKFYKRCTRKLSAPSVEI